MLLRGGRLEADDPLLLMAEPLAEGEGVCRGFEVAEVGVGMDIGPEFELGVEAPGADCGSHKAMCCSISVAIEEVLMEVDCNASLKVR